MHLGIVVNCYVPDRANICCVGCLQAAWAGCDSVRRTVHSTVHRMVFKQFFNGFSAVSQQFLNSFSAGSQQFLSRFSLLGTFIALLRISWDARSVGLGFRMSVLTPRPFRTSGGETLSLSSGFNDRLFRTPVVDNMGLFVCIGFANHELSC